MTHRRLDIAADDWRAQDITAVRELLAEVATDAEAARAARGSIVLRFEGAQGVHPYLDPAIGTFLQKVYSEFPYLLYFLDPDRSTGSLDTLFASLGALCETPQGIWVLWDDDIGVAYYRALGAAAEFAIERGDDWGAVVRSYEGRESVVLEVRDDLVARGVLPS